MLLPQRRAGALVQGKNGFPTNGRSSRVATNGCAGQVAASLTMSDRERAGRGQVMRESVASVTFVTFGKTSEDYCPENRCLIGDPEYRRHSAQRHELAQTLTPTSPRIEPRRLEGLEPSQRLAVPRRRPGSSWKGFSVSCQCPPTWAPAFAGVRIEGFCRGFDLIRGPASSLLRAVGSVTPDQVRGDDRKGTGAGQRSSPATGKARVVDRRFPRRRPIAPGGARSSCARPCGRYKVASIALAA